VVSTPFSFFFLPSSESPSSELEMPSSGMVSETLAFVSFMSMSRNSPNLTFMSFMDDVNVVSNFLISAMDAMVSLALARSASSSLCVILLLGG
jgi:hypothetical protein